MSVSTIYRSIKGSMGWCLVDEPTDAIWEHLRRALGDTDLIDDCDGEAWQYMGSRLESYNFATHSPSGKFLPTQWRSSIPRWVWNHQFRHRSYRGQRRYINVVADEETTPFFGECPLLVLDEQSANIAADWFDERGDFETALFLRG